MNAPDRLKREVRSAVIAAVAVATTVPRSAPLPARATGPPPKPGDTLASLVAARRRSPEWKGLASGTRDLWETQLAVELRQEWVHDALLLATVAGMRRADLVGHVDEDGERAKHLHDVRGTFLAHLCRAELTDEDIANVAAWSPATVARIRRTYVDDAATVVALSERIRRAL